MNDDDRVLVLLVHGDPAQGIVLGGLYGAGGPYDTGIGSGAESARVMSTGATSSPA